LVSLHLLRRPTGVSGVTINKEFLELCIISKTIHHAFHFVLIEFFSHLLRRRAGVSGVTINKESRHSFLLFQEQSIE